MGTNYAGTKEEMLTLDSYIKLTRATEAVNGAINAHLRQEGLTLSQFSVLDALHHIGPMTVGQLGEKIFRTSGNMTMVVDNLVKRGLVSRRRCAEDRRRVDVALTDDGRTLIKRIWPEHLEEVMVVWNVLSAEEQQHLGSLCRKLGLAQS